MLFGMWQPTLSILSVPVLLLAKLKSPLDTDIKYIQNKQNVYTEYLLDRKVYLKHNNERVLQYILFTL